MSHFQKPVPGTAVVSRFFSQTPMVAAITFPPEPSPTGFTFFSVEWFHSKEEASLWLESKGIPYEVAGFEVNLHRLYFEGAIVPFSKDLT